jgi:hypothetical protein
MTTEANYPVLAPRFDALPDPEALRRTRIAGLVSATPLPKRWKREFELSEAEWEKTTKFWSEFRGPAKSTERFFVVCPLDASGETVGLIEYDRGRLRFDLFEGEEELRRIPWDLIPHKEPPPARERSARLGPNDRCSCGSGKKFKKCCAFRV